ncbi:MAG: protoheme IX farnesyltransferase [Deltaproteobacteria bacterium RIFCSPLOWO2_02_56_12]|nr:MAG: protoheme IX farnesyltransferase [Deltaproteobacteria bacterium RIFCSPLOWO2_02_56_12]
MTLITNTLDIAFTGGYRRALDFLELTKPRVSLMVLVTMFVGFYLGSEHGAGYLRLIETLIGTALAAGGTLALNQFLERRADALMARTRHRPLPDGRMQPTEALLFGVGLTAAGLLILALTVNALSALVTASIVGSYLFIYTPLKQRSSLCGVVGAVPGALPPVIGWTAATGGLSIEAWVLFAIMFFWQIPHTLAIARLYRDDFAKAGIQFLPVIESDGWTTGRQIITHSLALLVVSLLPTLLGLAGTVYFLAALLLGSGFLWYGIGLAISQSLAAARRLLLASLIYLPLLLVVMALDRILP